MAGTATVFPGVEQFLGIGRETTSQTAVLPTVTIPVDEALPDDKPMFLRDKSLRGDMATDASVIQGVEIAEISPKGNVYVDTIGHFLYNILGDYTATGAAGSGSTTLTAQVTAGATTATVASITGFSSGQAVQIGITADGNPEIVVLSTAPSGLTLTFTGTPARFTHASGKTVAGVVAPFAHVFSLLNSGTGQPPTHTLTHHQGITATVGSRAYASWCASQLEFDMGVEKLFTHSVKGTSFLGVPSGSTPTNAYSTALALPSWRFLTGIGGPATGGTLLSDIQEAGVSIDRAVKPIYTLQNSQNPFIIARGALNVAGKMTFLAQDETPLTTMLNNTQPQIQYVISNGLAGSNLLSFQFDMQIGAYEVSKIGTSGEFFEYAVNFCAVANTTNVGASGARSPIKVTISNAIPTY